MSLHTPPSMPRHGLATIIRATSAPYEKKFAHQVINHRRNVERDMLVALSVFVRKHGRAALGFTK